MTHGQNGAGPVPRFIGAAVRRVQPFWASIRATIQGRHLFDLSFLLF